MIGFAAVASALHNGVDASKPGYSVVAVTGTLRNGTFTPNTVTPNAVQVTVERPDGVRELECEPDDEFANVLHAFVDEVRTGVHSGLSGEAVVAQAALVDRVRAVARYVDVG